MELEACCKYLNNHKLYSESTTISGTRWFCCNNKMQNLNNKINNKVKAKKHIEKKQKKFCIEN